MRLTGPWRAAVVDDQLRRIGADPGLDDSRWAAVPVPGHWAASPTLSAGNGPVIYRCRFSQEHEPESHQRFWLRFDGVMSGSEVWLDGDYLGDTVGYFAPHRFEITNQVAARSDHLLAVDVSCPPGGGLDDENRTKVALTGSIQTGALAPPINPGGLWRPVAVDATGPVAIRHDRLLCLSADRDRATLRIRLVVDAATATSAIFTTTVTPLSGPGDPVVSRQQTRELANGENRLAWTVAVDQPQLWWPAGLGDQPLYRVDVAVEVESPDGGEMSDSRTWTTGLRSVEMDNFVFRCNGERLFLPTVAYGPAGPRLGDLNADRFAQDLAAAREAGFAMVRVFGHISRPELYTEADRTGMVLWQDLPLVGGYSSKVRRAVKTTIREAVDHLGHHPAVVIWGGHVSPNGDLVSSTDPERAAAAGERRRTVRRAARHMLPSWNRSVLDSIISRELGKMDPSRPVVARSGVLPSVGEADQSDTHLWLGWRTGSARDVARLFARWPRLAMFPGGIGTQTAAHGDWPLSAPEWSTAERAGFERYVPRRAYGDGDAWSMASEIYQSDVVRAHIEAVRTLRYRPSGGFCITALADPEPSGGFGLLDDQRQPKPAYQTVVDACRSVVVLAGQLPLTVVPGQEISVDLHIDSSLRHRLDEAVLVATFGGPDWPEDLVTRQGFRGSVEADATTTIGTITVTVPDVTGAMVLDLELQASDPQHRPVDATNRYRTVIIPAAESLAELSRRTRRSD